ncbi:hypothetical protein [Neobacillus kokaensis]|uniref:Uncharacterized protein n=1 Tax=Neobacillus kokaensis TaxID=2759023 RepID=A0ABQ3N6N1_9BACI|nr:hypothetical protein [Neobacillus kokaensis]GHH99696.1 hypothetical protein AM1BK_32390 [Neobacillus kokaensis]
MNYLTEIKEKSNQILSFWSSPMGWVPNSAIDKLTAARLDWIKELTNCI